jgi:RNA polymerase sigma-70 factor, ECF subfamily
VVPDREQPSVRPTADRLLVQRLRQGDEAAFEQLIDTYHGPLLRLARTFVRDREVAAEVVQETWLGVIRGIERFEGRSSLRTWIFRILTNTARKRGVREARTIPFAALAGADGEEAVDPDRFLPAGAMWAGHWAAPPASWGTDPEQAVLADEARGAIEAAIAVLPDLQRQVVTLRDVEGWSSEEVCELLELTEGNQRVLLHRARAKVRQALEDYFNTV